MSIPDELHATTPPSPTTTLLHLLYGAMTTQLISVAAQLGLADLLGENVPAGSPRPTRASGQCSQP